MTWLRRMISGLFVAALMVLAATPIAGAVTPRQAFMTPSPVAGQAGDTFSVTYTIKGQTSCGHGNSLEIHWDGQGGPLLKSVGWPGTCTSMTVTGLKPPTGAYNGPHNLAGLLKASGTLVDGSVATAGYTVQAPPPPPPPPPPTPPPAPQPTATATTTSAPTAASNPTPAAVAAATDAGAGAGPPPAAATTDPSPATVPPVAANPGAGAAAQCRGAACPTLTHPTAGKGVVAVVQSVLGKSPLLLLGAVLVAVAAVLFVALQRSQSRRAALAAVAVAARPRAADPTSLDPVVPDPSERQIYVPPVPEPLPTGDELIGDTPRPGRARPPVTPPALAAAAVPAVAAPLVSPQPAATKPPTPKPAPARPTAASIATSMIEMPSASEAPPPAAPAPPRPAVKPAPQTMAVQDTEGILPHELFSDSQAPDETIVMKPAPGSDGLPAMAPPPPRK